MTRTELYALLTIIDAKINTYNARDSSDGGLIESIREQQLVEDFCEKYIDKPRGS